MLWDSNLAVIIHSPQYWTNNILILFSELPTSESPFLPLSSAEMYVWSHRSWTLEQSRIQQFWRSEPRADSVTAMGRSAAWKERLKAEVLAGPGRPNTRLSQASEHSSLLLFKWLASPLQRLSLPLRVYLVVGTKNFRHVNIHDRWDVFVENDY